MVEYIIIGIIAVVFFTCMLGIMQSLFRAIYSDDFEDQEVK